MKVYAFFDSSPSAHPDQPEFLRLWALSWERRGFTPKLLTARHAARSKFYAEFIKSVDSSTRSDYRRLQWLALHAVRGTGWLVSPQILNFSLLPKRRSRKLPSGDIDVFSLNAYRVSRNGVKEFLKDLYTNRERNYRCRIVRMQFPSEHLTRYECAADALNSGRLM